MTAQDAGQLTNENLRGQHVLINGGWYEVVMLGPRSAGCGTCATALSTGSRPAWC